MIAKRLENIHEIDNISKEWTDLMEMNKDASIFQHPEWIRLEWKHMGWFHPSDASDKISLILIRDGKTLEGVFPISYGKHKIGKLPIKKISLFSPFSMRRNAVYGKDTNAVASAIVEHLCKNRDWDLLELKAIPTGSPFKIAIEECFKENGMNVIEEDYYKSPYISISCTWEEYIQGRSKNMKKSITYSQNKFKKAGDVKVSCFQTIEEVNKAIDIIFEIDMKSWKGREGTAISSNALSREYFSDLSRSFAEIGKVQIWVLWLSDVPIAFEYLLTWSDRVYALKWSYDEAYNEYSPGMILKINAYPKIWAAGFKEVDLLSHSDQFKLKWTDNIREHSNLHIFNNGYYAKSLYLGKRYVVPNIKSLLGRR